MVLWLNMLGEIIFYYNGPTLYDKFLHLSLGVLLTVIVFKHYQQNSNLKKAIMNGMEL
jgi:hypothetical protein